MAEKLAGTCTVPKGVSLPDSSRGFVPCVVKPRGRVCGTAMGIPWTLTVSSTSRARIRIMTASAIRAHW